MGIDGQRAIDGVRGIRPSGDARGAATGLASGGAGNDHLSGFEDLTGSIFNDVLRGDANQNIIDGNLGTDTCDGGGGNDTLISCP